MLIRDMTASDLQKIADIERDYASPWSTDQVYAELKRPGGVQLVAADDSRGTVFGWCCARCIGPESELLKIATRPDQLRHGVAGRLLAGLYSRLHSQGIKTLFLEVRSRNAAAIGLYTKNGFTQVGTRPAYYSKPSDDALIFNIIITQE